MAVKRKGNNNTKENLTWKLNVLAAKVGEDTHIEQAKVAAFGTKQPVEPPQIGTADQEKLIMELNEIKKKKLEAKLFHVRKEIKAGLKKSKTLETQKQVKKLREAQSSVTSLPEDSTDSADKVEKPAKKSKSYTAQDVERFEKELDIIKNINLEPLEEKALSNMIRKNTTLKKDHILSSILTNSTPTPTTTATENTKESATSVSDDNKNLINDVEARLLGNKALNEPLKKSVLEIEMLLVPEQRKVKRKIAAAEQQASNNKRPKPTSARTSSSSSSSSSSSLFMESLGGDKPKNTKGTPSTNWEDPDFEKYYNGGTPEKQNRPGQNQRRMKWEAIHGKKAKHIASGKESVNETRSKKHQSKQRQLSSSNGHSDNKRPFNKPSQGNNVKKVEENFEEFHPSWQAKRQQQEMMAKALSGSGAGNNKIVFDDA
ncbi:hypothetical protein BC941DRAFT_418276 [Chlamydoabsidia padenii]|nr:hypothetical protein BC941DRAFT_418276 [Chlamydoabsidia padenii]